MHLNKVSAGYALSVSIIIIIKCFNSFGKPVVVGQDNTMVAFVSALVFQAVLSGANALQKNEAASAASAILELGPTGGLDYTVRDRFIGSFITYYLATLLLESSCEKEEEEENSFILRLSQ